MDKNGLPWEENDYVKMNICIQINRLKMQQFWTDSLDDPVALYKESFDECFDTMLMLKVKLKTLQIFLYLGIYNIYEKLLPGSHKGIKENSRLHCVLACFMIYLPDSLFSKLSL